MYSIQAVRLGESPDPESPGKWGTATLRMCGIFTFMDTSFASRAGFNQL